MEGDVMVSFNTTLRGQILFLGQVTVLFFLIKKVPKRSSPARSSAGRAGQRT
jgi:hypothetical protein